MLKVTSLNIRENTPNLLWGREEGQITGGSPVFYTCSESESVFHSKVEQYLALVPASSLVWAIYLIMTLPVAHTAFVELNKV